MTRDGGLSNWQAHYEHAADRQRSAGIPALVQERMGVIQQNASATQYASLYAAVSVRIAELGRAALGWLDGPDPRAGRDQGRGISNRDAHYGHAVSSPGNAQGSVALVGDRLSSASAASESLLSYMSVLDPVTPQPRQIRHAAERLTGRWTLAFPASMSTTGRAIPPQSGTLDIRGFENDKFAGTVIVGGQGGSTTAITVSGTVFQFEDVGYNISF